MIYFCKGELEILKPLLPPLLLDDLIATMDNALKNGESPEKLIDLVKQYRNPGKVLSEEYLYKLIFPKIDQMVEKIIKNFEMKVDVLKKDLEQLNEFNKIILDENNKLKNGIKIWKDQCVDIDKSEITLNENGGVTEVNCVFKRKAIFKEDICTYEPEVAIQCHTKRIQGCFLGGVKIRMADKSLVDIELIKEGDIVFNPFVQKGFKVKQVFSGDEKEEMIKLTVGDDSLVVTRNHAMWVNGKFIKAQDIKLKDEVIYYNEARYLHKSVYEKKENVVYNLLLEDGDSWEDHIVEANGIMTGDIKVQKFLDNPD